MLLTLICGPQLWLTSLDGEIADRGTLGHLLIVARIAHGIEFIVGAVVHDDIQAVLRWYNWITRSQIALIQGRWSAGFSDTVVMIKGVSGLSTTDAQL